MIFGNDFVRRGNAWRARPAESRDSVVKTAKNFDERHTYRVLLTRGLQGCILFSVDEETNAFLPQSAVKRLWSDGLTSTEGYS